MPYKIMVHTTGQAPGDPPILYIPNLTILAESVAVSMAYYAALEPKYTSAQVLDPEGREIFGWTRPDYPLSDSTPGLDLKGWHEAYEEYKARRNHTP